jgi:hypothetical protein
MARTWGATRAKFWDIVGYGPGLLAVTVGGDTYLETVVDNSVTWTRLISQIGQGAASFYATPGWDDWLTPGRVCVVEKVTNHTDGDARLLACFIIEDIEPKGRQRRQRGRRARAGSGINANQAATMVAHR